ncbi:MAG: 3-hydroxyacyl-CoA dehydrogenase family protein, partial [Deltaproteobacteria bacterium]|nr:3-hydroxyacyl-CoA dehydrogenase family protein [Deltaproteobacteria bacterium]
VPYYNVLLEDETGVFHLRKQFGEPQIGEEFLEHAVQRQEMTIGVVGTGIMATGLAALFLQHQYPLVVIGRSDKSVERCKSQVRRMLLKGLDEGVVEDRFKGARFQTEVDGMGECDLIIESIVEDLDVKKDLLQRIERVCSQEAIFATNTSSLSIAELAKVLKYPERFLGLHFFNPVARMRLVEVVRGPKTSQETIHACVDLINAVDKDPIVINDSPCFIVNRILMPFLNEAVKVYQEGVADAENIDKAAMLGLNHPIGPLALIDLIGVDVFVKIMDNLNLFLGENYKPASTAKNLVTEEKLGRKTGGGFYKYQG